MQQRSKGLATKLLRELYINASIVVAEKRNYGLAGMAGPYACDLGIIAVPLGLPPIVDYLLTDAKRKGSVVLAVGRHTVYYTRGEQQIDKGFTDGGGCSRHENKARYRVEYLSELLGTTPKELNFSATPSYRIIWGGAQNYRREVLRIRKEIRKSYNHLLAQLIDADMLTEQEANELAPHIEFQVNDIRKDQSIALPKI